jgi:hypothetical protein
MCVVVHEPQKTGQKMLNMYLDSYIVYVTPHVQYHGLKFFFKCISFASIQNIGQKCLLYTHSTSD